MGKIQDFRVWTKENKIRHFFVDLVLGLIVVLAIYFLGRFYYNHKLKIGEKCYTYTTKVFIDESNNFDQLGFEFINAKTGKVVRTRSPKPVGLDTFDFSKKYIVKYLCDDDTYKEIILEVKEERRLKRRIN
jgi:hypothetical protein